MSMTWEEAIEILENGGWWDLLIPVTTIEGRIEEDKLHEAIDLAVSALRPVSREQVEKMKKEPVEGGYDELYAPTYKCPECGFENTGRGNFCQNCGCPYTDEAVDMVMERLEALKDGSTTD